MTPHGVATADLDVRPGLRVPSHSILVIAWHLLATGTDYNDLGGDWFTRSADPDRRRTNLVNQLQALGYAVTLRPVA